ncbi:MAG: hypothetical protein J6Y56_02580 [Fibrobacterales bacterium]|nr:hypothetical protein [Fibrobacterales bacterium]
MFSGFVSLSLLGCTETSGPSGPNRYALVEKTASNVSRSTYRLQPNDSLPGDSVLNHLGSGVMMWTQPGGDYLLEVETDAEEMELDRFELLAGNRIRTSPRITDGVCDGERCTFAFSGGNELSFWLAALAVDGGRKGATGIRSVRFGGEGTNSARLPVTILFLGELTGLPSDSARGAFAENLVAEMGALYASAGVEVELRGWSRGSGHPVASYAAALSDTATFWFDVDSWTVFWNARGYRELDADELSRGWPSDGGEALEIVVVEAIDELGCIGISPLPGVTLGFGTGAVAVVGAQAKASNRSLVPNTPEQIALTMAHEVGHFLGLRHTTATWDDRLTFLDDSMHDDGLSDTPFDYLCDAGIAAAPAEGAVRTGTARFRLLPKSYEKSLRADILGLPASDNCPDRNNLMFPYTSSSADNIELSPSQGLLMRTNLRLLPH